MTRRRVVVTGMGMVSPIGHSVETSWQAAIAGQSGIRINEGFDTEAFGVKICGNVVDFDISEYMNPKEARRMDGFIQLGVAAATQAIKDAGLTDHPDDADRIGVAIGSGIGGIDKTQSDPGILTDLDSRERLSVDGEPIANPPTMSPVVQGSK